MSYNCKNGDCKPPVYKVHKEMNRQKLPQTISTVLITGDPCISADSRRGHGNFARHSQNADGISDALVSDFKNPWVFFNFFKQDKLKILEWFQQKHLIKKVLTCKHCKSQCILSRRERSLDGYTFRCDSGTHEFSVRSESFFKKFRFSLADITLFIMNLLDGLTLKQNAIKIGIDYTNAAPRWAKIVRKIMAERVWREYFINDGTEYKFSHFVQCDESKFGRKVKANSGCPRGRCVWLAGLIERHTGRLLLLPVENRYPFISIVPGACN